MNTHKFINNLEDIKLDYLNNKNITSLARRYKCRFEYMKQFLIKYCPEIDLIGMPDMTLRYLDLSNLHKSIIIGLLLGDGCLTQNSKSTSLVLSTTCQYWTESMCTLLPFDYRFRHFKRPYLEDRFLTGFTYASKYYPQLSDYRSIWYPNKKKIIPLNLELNPIMLLHWFYGDGTTNYNKGNLIRFTFCTDSFTRDENLYLIDIFKHKYNITFKLVKGKGTNTRISLYRQDDIHKLFNIMYPYHYVDAFSYKFKNNHRITCTTEVDELANV